MQKVGWVLDLYWPLVAGFVKSSCDSQISKTLNSFQAVIIYCCVSLSSFISALHPSNLNGCHLVLRLFQVSPSR